MFFAVVFERVDEYERETTRPYNYLTLTLGHQPKLPAGGANDADADAGVSVARGAFTFDASLAMRVSLPFVVGVIPMPFQRWLYDRCQSLDGARFPLMG